MVAEQVLYTFGWAPWSCIVAGMITALALSALFWVIGVALGFTVISPKSDDPFAGIGYTFGIWGVVSIVLSMAGGGFMAGFLAGQRGLEIGFLVWAVTVLGGMLFGGAAHAAAAAGKTAADAVSGIVQELKDNIHIDIDHEKINDNVMQALRDTGIDALQPEYLKDQLREARSGFRNMLHQLMLNPTKPEEAVCDFLEETKKRINGMTEDIDKDAAATALMNARGIPREEAVKIVDNALEAYDAVLRKAKETVADAKEMMEESKVRIRQMTEKAKEKADDMAGTAAKAAFFAAAGLIIAAAICMGAAYCGAKYAPVWGVAGQTQSISIQR